MSGYPAFQPAAQSRKPLGNVLIVDDDEQVCDFAACVLSHAGYAVTATGRAGTVLDRVDREFDIALLDVELGADQDGVEIAHALRAAGGTDVIIITARHDVQTAVRAIREGVFDYLLKPFRAEDLRLAFGRYAERRRLSEELARERALSERLSLEIARRERIERHVLQMQKMEALGRFAGTIAHDFNNYLTVIGGLSHILLGSNLAPGLKEDVEQIQGAARRAAALAGQILALGRKEARIPPPPLDVDELLRGMRNLLVCALTRRISPTMSLAATEPVLLSAPRLREILINLALNARDAMPDGGALSIRTSEASFHEGDPGLCPEGRPGRYVRLEVADSGAGMDGETLERVFEPFFTTKGQGAGSGLGLSLVYESVRSAGGWTEVYSKIGTGTTVRMYFPVARTSVDHRTPAEAVGGASSDSQEASQWKRVPS